MDNAGIMAITLTIIINIAGWLVAYFQGIKKSAEAMGRLTQQVSDLCSRVGKLENFTLLNGALSKMIERLNNEIRDHSQEIAGIKATQEAVKDRIERIEDVST